MIETEDLEDQTRIQLWKERLQELARVVAYKELSLPDKIKYYTQSKKYIASLQIYFREVSRRQPTPFSLVQEIQALIIKAKELKEKFKP